jgi:hypothetical protein
VTNETRPIEEWTSVDWREFYEGFNKQKETTMTSIEAWLRVAKWELITKPLMNRSFRHLDMKAPNFGGTLQNKHDEWVRQIWENRKRKAVNKIIDLCPHKYGVDEDGYCVSCGGETTE